jgi:hypothetical protein
MCVHPLFQCVHEPSRKTVRPAQQVSGSNTVAGTVKIRCNSLGPPVLSDGLDHVGAIQFLRRIVGGLLLGLVLHILEALRHRERTLATSERHDQARPACRTV